jgi:hypothetical protein
VNNCNFSVSGSKLEVRKSADFEPFFATQALIPDVRTFLFLLTLIPGLS